MTRLELKAVRYESVCSTGSWAAHLRAGGGRGQEDLQHVEIGQAHLVDDDGWVVDARCCEGGAENGTGAGGSQDVG